MAAVTSGQGVLLPESTRAKRKQRTITVAVNSRDRNVTADYSSNNFRWAFQRPLKDILSIELVNGCIPADFYNISTNWNQFTFGEAQQRSWAVTLTPGQYTPTELAAELQTRLNGLAGAVNTYTVLYNSITRRITITATGGADFTFFFFTSPFSDAYDTYTGALTSVNNPGRILGFEWSDYTSTAGSLTPPNRVDTDMFLKKLYLHINADNSVELNRLEMGAGRKSCFHILYMDQIRDGYYTLNKDLHTPVFYSAPAPIARMATMTISLRDESYRLVDLGNHDYTLMFEITVIE